MVNSTRASKRAKDGENTNGSKDGENTNGRATRSSEKGINTYNNVSDTAAIRKSSREVASKKIIGNPPSTRKSERLEKKAPPTPASTVKSGRVVKKKMPSPLTMPGRTRSHSSSIPSDSKSTGSSSSGQKLKKEKSVKQLTFEAKEVNENKECGSGTSGVKKNRMDARMYRSLFRPRKGDFLPKLNRIGESSHEGVNNSGAKIDKSSDGGCSDHKEVFMSGTLPSENGKAKETRVDSRLNGTVTGLVENNETPCSFMPSSAPTYETSVVTERIQPDCCGEENMLSRNSMFDNVLDRNSVGNDGVAKRKGITVDMDSDVSATLSKDGTFNLIADASPSGPGVNTLNTDGPCSKKKRLDYNHTFNESCDPHATEDGNDMEATMLRKSYPANTTALDSLSDSDKDGLISNSNNNVVQMKEKLSSHIAYRCKSDSFKFVEYWVPVQISHMQLEQYCATLLSNASTLCSSSKIDSVGAIRDVLISIRKCCNHPYVVDPSLPNLLVGIGAGESLLDVGIKASGKLQLLDSMFRELKKKDLRALVLFQSIGGSGKDTIGIILEDYLIERFGPDSYERIDKGLTSSRKQAAMKKFNDKNNGCFVFLLETCACLPSIKLSSIDTIIIFDSDWNPMNDIKSLQKISLDSQFELIKLFRFYSAFTVEEKALVLATKDKTLDINLMNTNRGTSHMVLMWGASCLFDELRVFHDGATSTSSLKSLFDRPLLEESVQEFSSILSKAGEDTDTSNCSILLKVQQNGVAYRTNFPLFGELKLRPLNEESPQLFWTKLLEGKEFQWKYSCCSSQRSRKRVQRYGSLVGGADLASDGIAKKRRKVSNNIVEQPSSNFEGEKLSTGTETDRLQGNGVESQIKSRVRDEQRSLHLSLKPEIRKLCEVLRLPDNVTKMAGSFLDYVMKNHHIDREPMSILQAFQISLIWTAAALVKHKLDHKASLILAKQYLNFDCTKGVVDYIYSRLRCLRKIFLYRTGRYSDTDSPKASKSSNSVYSCTGVGREVKLFKTDLSKSIKEIRKKCEKQMKKLCLKQQEEKQTFELHRDESEKKYKMKLAFIRSCSPNDVMRTENLKVSNAEYEKLKCKLEAGLKLLEDRHSAQILQFRVCEATWVEDLKVWAQNELSKTVASKELGTGFDNMVESMAETGTGFPETDSQAVVLCSSTVEQKNSLVKPVGANKMGIMASDNCTVSASEDHNITINQHDSQENSISGHFHSKEQNSDGATIMTDEYIGHESFDHGSRDGCGMPSLENCLPVNENLAQPLEMPGTDNITSCPENATAFSPTLSTELLSDGGAVNKCLDRVLSRSSRPVSLSNGPDNITILDQHLEHQISNGVSSSVPEEQNQAEVQETNNEGDSASVLERQVLVARPGDCPDSVFLSNLPFEQQMPAASLSICGDTPVTVAENSHAMADCHQDIEPSRDAVLADLSTTCNQEEGMLRTGTKDTLSLDYLGSRSVDVREPLEQGHQLAGEMHSSPEQVELASNSAVAVPANQPSVASSDFSFATEAVHQPIDVGDLTAHHPKASNMAQNPDVVQPHSNLELDLHSYQAAMNPATNSDLGSLTASGVRAQSSNPRYSSILLEMNDHHIQTAAHSASSMFAHLHHDPLRNELERIQKVKEQTKKSYEEMKLQATSDFEKEVEELRKKYHLKLKEMEVEFQQRKKTLDANLNTVCMNNILAAAFRSKCLDMKVSGASGTQHDSRIAQQLLQLSRLQRATHPLSVSGFSSCESPVTSLPSPSTAASSQHMASPIQAGYNIPGAFSNLRSPLINSRPPPVGDIRAAGGEVRFPAPHLQPYIPAKFVPASNFPTVLPANTSQPAPSSIPATSSLFSQGPPRPRSTTYQSDLQRGRQPDSAGGLATPNLPAMKRSGNASSHSTLKLTNVQHVTEVASAKVSKSGTNSNSVKANSSHEASTPDLVCLSDDD